MSDVIIIIVLAAAIALGVRESVKHFKGEGGCCGGGSSYKPKKKKLEGTITHTYVLQVEDMHCQNCANTITGAVNDIEGAGATVIGGEGVIAQEVPDDEAIASCKALGKALAEL